MAIKMDMLKCFAVVAKTGSLAEAAQSLGRTPSAVSMMLKQFEDHIGTPLFETARKSKLTPIGKLVFEQAQREVIHFDTTVAMIAGIARSEEGYLRLAVTPSVAATILPPLISRFTQGHPKVQIDLRDMDSAAIAVELNEGRADIGIGTLPEIEGFSRIEVFNDPFGVICPSDHALATNWDSLTWRDMQDYSFILNGLSHLITDPDFAPIRESSQMMVRSLASLLGLVRAGVGITVLPKLAIGELQSDLVFLPLIDAAARRHVHMVSKPAMLLLPAARDFAALVKSAVKQGEFDDLHNSAKLK